MYDPRWSDQNVAWLRNLDFGMAQKDCRLSKFPEKLNKLDRDAFWRCPKCPTNF